MLRVSIQRGTGDHEVLEFPYQRTVSFGRSPDNDIVLSGVYVSRAHGRFLRDEQGWCLECLSDSGLVLVRNGENIDVTAGSETRNELEGGEAVRVAATRMDVEIVADLPVSAAADAASLAFSRVIDATELQKKLHEESKNFGLILELTEDLNRMTDFDEVLHRIAKSMFQALPNATHFSVNVRSPEGVWEPVFGALRGGAELDRDQVVASQSIMQLVLEREMAAVFHTSEDEADPSASMVIHNITSSMAVPLRGSKEIVGVMVLDNRATLETFSTEDLDLIVILAHSAASALERARLQERIQHMFEGFINASVTAIESRDPTTSGHSRRVAQLSVALAGAAGRCASGPLASCSFSEHQVTELAYAGLLHDFGKVGVSERILVKENRLFPEQMERIESRFQLARVAHRAELLTELLESGAASRSERLQEIRRECDVFEADQEEILEFLRSVNAGGVVDETLRIQLAAISATQFIDGNGKVRRLLDDEELEALSIPRGTLTEKQRRAIQEHVMESFRFLRQIPWPEHLARIPEIVLMHHEKLDATGYPRGLADEQIPAQARLLTVVDIFDAVTASDRPYRAAMSVDRGLDLLREEAADGKLDAAFVELFIAAELWRPDRVSGIERIIRSDAGVSGEDTSKCRHGARSDSCDAVATASSWGTRSKTDTA